MSPMSFLTRCIFMKMRDISTLSQLNGYCYRLWNKSERNQFWAIKLNLCILFDSVKTREM